jgi:hypothetical protein
MKQIPNNKNPWEENPYQPMDFKNLKKKIRKSRTFIFCDFHLRAAGALDEP